MKEAVGRHTEPIINSSSEFAEEQGESGSLIEPKNCVGCGALGDFHSASAEVIETSPELCSGFAAVREADIRPSGG